MNCLVRNLLRGSAIKNILFSTSNNGSMNNNLYRTLWNMCNRQNDAIISFAVPKIQNSQIYGYECNRNAHTKGKYFFLSEFVSTN